MAHMSIHLLYKKYLLAAKPAQFLQPVVVAADTTLQNQPQRQTTIEGASYRLERGQIELDGPQDISDSLRASNLIAPPRYVRDKAEWAQSYNANICMICNPIMIGLLILSRLTDGSF